MTSPFTRGSGAFLMAATLSVLIGSQADGDEPKPRAAANPFRFKDSGDETGLFPHLTGIHGHAAGWGDVDGDGWIDLYVGTFHSEGSPNLFFRNEKGAFRLDDQETLKISTRASAALFADLDNDGDLDLYVSSMPAAPESGLAKRLGRPILGCTLFRNDGKGKFTNVSDGNAAAPAAFGGRSATVLDYDGDGLLDLLVGEDPVPGYNGSKTKSSRLFRNLGGLQFEDVSRSAGIPENIPGLGVAAADVNNDSLPDFFIASSGGGNRLFVNNGDGTFREPAKSQETFAWATAKGDDMVCGVCFGDVNRDGLLDVILGQHYSTPWVQPVAERLYLNRGIKNGDPTFEDVTEKVGLIPLPMKGPHVEFQDYDNDGWVDLSVSLAKFANGETHPLIFKNLGVRDGLPQFKEYVLAANDFPTDDDRAVKRSGPFFEKMIKEGKIIYMAPGPSGDYDNDGRLDMFLPNWWAESRSLLLRNETPGGHWLQVQVEGDKDVNRMGIGSRIKIYPAGKLGDAKALLGCREVAAGFGYASGQAAIAHFGLGDAERVDIEVILPNRKGTVTRKDVKADQRLTVTR